MFLLLMFTYWCVSPRDPPPPPFLTAYRSVTVGGRRSDSAPWSTCFAYKKVHNGQIAHSNLWRQQCLMRCDDGQSDKYTLKVCFGELFYNRSDAIRRLQPRRPCCMYIITADDIVLNILKISLQPPPMVCVPHMPTTYRSIVCVCVFFPFILDFNGRTSRGHTGRR